MEGVQSNGTDRMREEEWVMRECVKRVGDDGEGCVRSREFEYTVHR